MESLIFDSFNKKFNYNHLKINYQKIKEFSDNFDDFFIPDWSEEVFCNDSFQNIINFIFLINTINFSYWNDKDKPKWFYIFNGTKYTGSFALFSAFKDALDNGYELFSPNFLKNLSENDLKNILEKYEEIPMFNERLKILKDIGKSLSDNNLKYFFDIFKNSNNSAIDLINKTVILFPSFNDSFIFEGNKYNFFKRVQLIPAMIYGRFQKENIFNDIDFLTVFADYRVPQTLRKLGLVDYSDSLNKKIINREYLEVGSDEELEIRISTIQASLCIKEMFNQKKYINSLHIDYFLWKKGKEMLEPDYDFHRTRTIYY
jgi:hypothetical protein